jgi:Icc-related predicted phosphoesterase
MKILTVADTVTDQLLETEAGKPFLSGIELIIACGDLPPEYLTSLRARYDVPLLYVLGNHDLRYDSAPPIGCRSIDRRLILYNDIRILGFSGSRWYNGNINQYTEQEMTGFTRKIWFQLWRNRGVDLIITHAPPRYIKDAEDRCHRGFHAFRKLIDKYQPKYLIHGHIHTLFPNDSDRITMVGTTRVINSYGYYTFEIESV